MVENSIDLPKFKSAICKIAVINNNGTYIGFLQSPSGSVVEFYLYQSKQYPDKINNILGKWKKYFDECEFGVGNQLFSEGIRYNEMKELFKLSYNKNSIFPNNITSNINLF